MSRKREKFVRLAELRVNRTINDLRLIKNLANRYSYEYTDADIDKILRVLQSELNEVKNTFRKRW